MQPRDVGLYCLGTLLMLSISGCSKQLEPGFAEEVSVWDAKGDPLPEEFDAVAGEGITLQLAFKPTSTNLEEWHGRTVYAPEKWRITPTIKDSSGKVVWPKNWYHYEFFDYSITGKEMSGTPASGQSENKVLWISPNVPPEVDPRLQCRWGRTRMLDKPGDYTLEINVYPTAIPRRADELSMDLGEGITVFSAKVHCVAPEPGQEPIKPRSAAIHLQEQDWQRKENSKLRKSLQKATVP